ncbi:Hypothetical predicted protein [Cloeon dipterum]|uniref:Uncharacterized protein n=1 Tax=Cloeon dipterum TaxID=197152 RepID=A0A8S1C7A3_9INSE|nr:Hypothetical predicted protein [Cloeon dipterum]
MVSSTELKRQLKLHKNLNKNLLANVAELENKNTELKQRLSKLSQEKRKRIIKRRRKISLEKRIHPIFEIKKINKIVRKVLKNIELEFEKVRKDNELKQMQLMTERNERTQIEKLASLQRKKLVELVAQVKAVSPRNTSLD